MLRRAYDAGVTGADRELGRLIDLLRRTAVFDRAIVVVTSDHGESFMDHDAAGHRDTYDEVIRIPLIVRLPGGEPAGRRIVESFSLDQLASTLLDLVDVESPVSLEGRSVAAALLGAAPIDEEPVFAAWFAPSAISPIYTTMRTRKFKRFDANVPPEELIEAFRRPAPTAFYDLVADPLERNDLAAAGLPEFEEFGRAMASAEERWRRLRQLHRVETPPVVDLDEKTEKALRGLGYLGDG